MSTNRHVVARLGEVPPGGRKLVTVKGREIALFNAAGEYFALLNRCPHEGASLCAGRLTGLAEAEKPGDIHFTRQGEVVKCPWHGWEFDLRTGLSVCDPSGTKVRRYAVSVEHLAAETFNVSVDGDYVLIKT